jgi:hypothetical protein
MTDDPMAAVWHYDCERGHRSQSSDPTHDRCSARVQQDGRTPSFSPDAYYVCGAEFTDDSPWAPYWWLVHNGLIEAARGRETP